MTKSHLVSLGTGRRLALASALVIATFGLQVLPPSEAAPTSTLRPGAVTTLQLTVSKEAYRAELLQARQAEEPYLARLAISPYSQDVQRASALRTQLDTGVRTRLAELDSIAGNTFTESIPFVPLVREAITSVRPSVTSAYAGSSQAGFSLYTYALPDVNPVGFVSEYFVNATGYPAQYGSTAAVHADLESSASPSIPPFQDGGGALLDVMICSDGVCHWQVQDYDLQILDAAQSLYCTNANGIQQCVAGYPCPDPQFGGDFLHCPRKHISLWGTRQPDSSGNQWTVGDPHHDNWGHTCPDDWDMTRDYVMNSVPAADVSSTGTTTQSNSGTLGCEVGTPAYHNGVEDDSYLKSEG